MVDAKRLLHVLLGRKALSTLFPVAFVESEMIIGYHTRTVIMATPSQLNTY